MYNMNSMPSFGSHESALVFNDLSDLTQKTISNMREVAFSIYHSQIIDERLDVSSDVNEKWYSYSIVLDSTPDSVLSMNKKFIEFCLDNGLIELLKSDVIFRFETGERNAAQPTETFISCSRDSSF